MKHGVRSTEGRLVEAQCRVGEMKDQCTLERRKQGAKQGG